jgi:hypothetical protein
MKLTLNIIQKFQINLLSATYFYKFVNTSYYGLRSLLPTKWEMTKIWDCSKVAQKHYSLKKMSFLSPFQGSCNGARGFQNTLHGLVVVHKEGVFWGGPTTMGNPLQHWDALP